MHLRKSLVAGAAALAAGLVCFGAAAQATVEVNGSTTMATHAVDGPFNSGTAVIAGIGATCSSGNVSGTTVSGGSGKTLGFSFTTLNMTCTSFLPGTLSMSVICAPTFSAGHQGTTGWTDIISGRVDMTTCSSGTAPAPSIQVAVGPCSFKVTGSVKALFQEPVNVVGGAAYQDFVLYGSGLATANPSIGCFGAIPTGTSIVLNNIDFNIEVTAGMAPGINVWNP